MYAIQIEYAILFNYFWRRRLNIPEKSSQLLHFCEVIAEYAL